MAVVVDLVTKVVDDFGPLSTHEKQQLRTDMEDFYKSIPVPDPKAAKTEVQQWHAQKKEDKLYKWHKFKIILEHPVARLIMAIAYIFIYRAITEYMNPTLSDPSKEE